MILPQQFFKPQMMLLLLIAACCGVLGAALAFQYIIGLQPCVLCYYQRVPYALVLILAVFARLSMQSKMGAEWHRIFPLLLMMFLVLFFAGAGIAIYHTGVEYHWWAGPDTCAAVGQSSENLDELFQQIMKTPPVRCDQVQWSLFGISMAGYNVLLSLALAVFCILGLREHRKNGW